MMLVAVLVVLAWPSRASLECRASRQFWDPARQLCRDCRLCAPPAVVLRPCGVQRDAVCGPVADLRIRWPRPETSRQRPPERPETSRQRPPERPETSRQRPPERPETSRQRPPERPETSRQRPPERPETSRQRPPERPETSRQRPPERPETSRQRSPERPETSRQRPPERPETSRQRPPERPETSRQRPPERPETSRQRPPERPETSRQRPPERPETSRQRPPERPETSRQRPPERPETSRQRPPERPETSRQRPPERRGKTGDAPSTVPWSAGRRRKRKHSADGKTHGKRKPHRRKHKSRAGAPEASFLRTPEAAARPEEDPGRRPPPDAARRTERLSAAEALVWDGQAFALALAVFACLFFFLVAAVYSLCQARHWRRLKSNFEADVEELSAQLSLAATGCGVLQSPGRAPACPADQGRCSYLEKLLAHKQEREQANVYIERQGSLRETTSPLAIKKE
ncbi:nipped-B-like protein [Bacillus rossius redtenbacheri]|uniref:nipped-B-like protein n=1 Tax=Bacillus rossius redtenbacheri TaxID=93214 RepID=UPI002FDD443F